MSLRISAVHLFLNRKLLGNLVAVEFGLRPRRSEPRGKLLISAVSILLLLFGMLLLHLAHINDNVVDKAICLSRHEGTFLLLAAVDDLDVVALNLVRQR
jgi:hypothetical protein